jgi:hypothetical protein
MTNHKVYIQNIKAIIRDIIIGLLLYIVCDYFEYITQLQDFFKNQALTIMGVILPINIAGIGQAHLSMNNIEEGKGFKIPAFETIRLDFKLTLRMLITCFVLCVICWCILNKHNANIVGIDIFDISIVINIISFVVFLQCLYETYYKGILEIPSIINTQATSQQHR